MTGTGVGDSGIGISAISRRNPEPAAEGRTADTRKADAPVAVTRHLKMFAGRADHPWSAAVEQGCSTLPKTIALPILHTLICASTPGKLPNPRFQAKNTQQGIGGVNLAAMIRFEQSDYTHAREKARGI